MPMADTQRTQQSKRLCALVVFFLITLLLYSPFHTAQARSPDKRSIPSPERLFSWGEDCREKLERSKQQKKVRQNWKRCISNYTTLKTYYPQHPLAPRALFEAAELYRKLYRYSGKSKDIEIAQRYYQQIVKISNDRKLTAQAELKLSELNKTDCNPSETVSVKDIRSWNYVNYTRVVLDTDREVRYKQKILSSPGEAVVLLCYTVLADDVRNRLARSALVLPKQIALSESPPGNLSVHIPLKEVQRYKVLPLSSPDRLVLDLFLLPSPKDPPHQTARGESSPDENSKTVKVLPSGAALAVKTIVLDPGHGGKDPGAIGLSGLTEKEVALDIALRLRSLIQNQLGKTVIMTRATDTYISLEDRTLLANARQADLFVSIHTNSHPKRSTRGVEIYLLGQSSDRRALAVAARENNTPEKSMDSLERVLQTIQHDLIRDYNIEESLKFAHETRSAFVSQLKYPYKIVDLGVKRAPFYVLLNANMPGILAEVSFISNPIEERRLGSGEYRQAIARALLEGIKAYMASLKAI
jgi:N-acetylmuramoyl-L-alanine amidase